MDIRELKNYIYENKYVEQILESIGCHHIKYHYVNAYWSCANATGDNNNAIIIYNNELLICTNYTRQMITSNRSTDIIDLVCYTKNLSLFDGLKYICNEIGMSYYHNFDEDVPECFRILKMIESMNINDTVDDKEKPLVPINEHILSYYKPYVNELFYEDNISYATQREFEIGFDEETNRYTIPIRSEIGDLVGVKGRYFYREIPEGFNKYVYIEPCSKSKILYGLYKTMSYIKQAHRVYVVESEKAVMQLWTYGDRNVIATGGKEFSQHQIDLIVRLGVEIVLALDKDVLKSEVAILADKFPNEIPISYIYDEEGLLEGHESPTDNYDKWNYLKKHNIYKIKVGA